MDGAILNEEDEKSNIEIDVIGNYANFDDWCDGEEFYDNRLATRNGFHNDKATFTMDNARLLSSACDYFLYFLPMNCIINVIGNTNQHARSTLGQ